MTAHYSTFKFFTSPEKEEAWLAHMAQQGWFLAGVSSFYRYTFEKGEPAPRAYKIDYRSLPASRDQADYLALFTDSGWQPVSSRAMNGAYYFYNRPGAAAPDIFSDEASRAGRNLRFASFFAWSLLPSFLPLLVLYLTGSARLANMGYQTPGLWQMTGAEFISHFLFETPFVLLRSLALLLPLLPLGLIVYFLSRSYLSYRRALRRQAI